MSCTKATDGFRIIQPQKKIPFLTSSPPTRLPYSPLTPLLTASIWTSIILRWTCAAFHVAPRRVCGSSPHNAFVRGCCQGKQYWEWRLPSPATLPPSLSYRRHWFSVGCWLPGLAGTMPGPTMWLHCPGHSSEQKSDREHGAMSSLDQRCPPFLYLFFSLPGEVCPSQHSLMSSMSHWVTCIRQGTLKIDHMRTCRLVKAQEATRAEWHIRN